MRAEFGNAKRLLRTCPGVKFDLFYLAELRITLPGGAVPAGRMGVGWGGLCVARRGVFRMCGARSSGWGVVCPAVIKACEAVIEDLYSDQLLLNKRLEDQFSLIAPHPLQNVMHDIRCYVFNHMIALKLVEDTFSFQAGLC
ncbi:hypothetical protein SKAU_G00209660 [Synaphobranchus kaupii]|uniref:Uncharacterized protein n=1 Tax=Synaphobranchus kaupii TaxID=118154 RepID=A0A9Q1F8N3_SYNKA|nr:hypothetical protein SKAU_G00209660 [Synaphobranchus kaupii]